MEIASLQFAGFVIVVLTVYYLLPRRPQNVWLLIVSYVFYVWWSWWYALALAALTLVNFALALRLRPEGQPRRTMIGIGIGVNLLALAVFKYENFFVPDLQKTLDQWGVEAGIGGLDVLLPIGMSFYIVAVISYLLDVYRGQMDAGHSLIDFALYMAYFPKLLSGPIERARAFLPRLAAQRIVDNDALARSFALIVIGVVRKVVFANTLFKMIPDDIFNQPGRFSSPELIIFLIVYAFALYNDFGGYTSVARGVSGLFGIELAPNFNIPYFARNLSEFWNRWHITLSHWLRDYIYFPTSRALLRRNPTLTNMPNVFIPPMLTMLASGLWHGTGWGMLLWGALHGIYLIIERLLALWRPAGPPHLQPRWRQGFATLLVFGLVMLAWVPFRAPNLTATFDYWQGIFDWNMMDSLPNKRILILVIILPALGLDWVQYRSRDELVFLRWPRLIQATLLALAMLATFVLTQSESGAPFIYQGF